MLGTANSLVWTLKNRCAGIQVTYYCIEEFWNFVLENDYSLSGFLIPYWIFLGLKARELGFSLRFSQKEVSVGKNSLKIIYLSTVLYN